MLGHKNCINNRHVMKNFPLAFCLATSFFLSACSGKLSGVVFNDTNGNNLHDPDETGIARAVFTVSRDGALVTSGVTKDDGSYEIPINKMGQYCVKVKANSALAPLPSLGGAAPNKEVKADTLPGDTANGTGTATGGTTPPSTAPASTPVTHTQTISSLQGCDPGSFNMIVNVPVAKNFSGMITRLPESTPITIKPGESFVLYIHYPASAVLQPLLLPPLLERPGQASALSTSVGARIDFSRSADPSMILPAASLTEDDIATQGIVLQAAKNIPIGDHTVTLQPEAVAPDDTPVLLRAQTITIHSKNDVALTLGFIGDHPPVLGEIVTIEIQVSNRNTLHYEGAQLDVALPTFASVVAATKPDYCVNQLTKFHCVFDVAEGTKKFNLQFQLPPPPLTNANSSFTVSGSLSLPDVESPVNNELAFSLGTTPP